MADRGPVIPSSRRPDGDTPTIRVRTVGPYIPPPPIVSSPVPPSSEPSGNASRRLGSRPADRTLSVNGANGAAPIVLGNEDLPVGGHIIYAKRFGARLVADFLISLGELPTAAIGNIKFGDKTAAETGATIEIHLGTAGDNSSGVITALAGSYTTRDKCARVTARWDWPNQDSGEYNPFDMTCTSKGIKCTNLDTLAFEATSNPVMIAHELLTNPDFRLNPYDPATDFVDAEWLLGQQQCFFDVGGGVPRWAIAGRIDQQATSESWIRQILDHCNGHMRPNGGKLGLWLDLPRDVALDGDSSPITFLDLGAGANLYARASVVHKGVDETCTVASVDYTDGENGYIDGNVQDPKPADVDPTVEYVEERFARSFTTRVQQANRQAKYLKKLKEISVDDFTLPAWQVGALPLEGDRVFVQSRRLIPGDQTVPNAGAVAGVEDVVIVGQTLSKLGVMLRARPYRDALYDDTLDTTGGPNPPGDDGVSAPDPPTDLVLENVATIVNGDQSLQIKITWTPALEPYTSFTRIMFSRDDGVSFEELGTGFQIGPVFLTNPTLGIRHVFDLYTVRTSTGQISTATEEDIIPTYTSDAVPEATQLKFLSNYLEFYGPILPKYLDLNPPPAPSVALSAIGFGGVTPGDHFVGSSRLFSWGEGLLGGLTTITVPAGNWELIVTNIDPTPPADILMKKLYISKVGPTSELYRVQEMAPIGTSGNVSDADATLLDNDVQPTRYDGIRGWEVFDAFGVADPTTDPMPLFADFKFPGPRVSPHHYARLDCTPIVHKNPGIGNGYAIKVWVRVLNRHFENSVGVPWETLNASPGVDPGAPGNFVENRLIADAPQDGSGFIVSELGNVGIGAVGSGVMWQSDGVTAPFADGQNDNAVVSLTAGLYFISGSGSGNPYSLSGFKIATDAGIVPPLYHIEFDVVNLDLFGAVLSLKHATGSDSGVQINCPNGVDYVVGGLYCAVRIRYDQVGGFYYVIPSGTGGGTPFDPDDVILTSIVPEDKWITIGHQISGGSFADLTTGLTLDTGTYDDLVIPNIAGILVDGTAGPVDITGMVPPADVASYDFHFDFIDNATGRTYTFKHEDAGSAAANRFWLPGGVDLVMTLADAAAGFRYDPALFRWRLRFTNF